MVAERVSNADRAKVRAGVRLLTRAGLKTRRLQSTLSRGTRIMKPAGWAIGSHPNGPDRIVKSRVLVNSRVAPARRRASKGGGLRAGYLDRATHRAWPGLLVAILRRAGGICMAAGWPGVVELEGPPVLRPVGAQLYLSAIGRQSGAPAR